MPLTSRVPAHSQWWQWMITVTETFKEGFVFRPGCGPNPSSLLSSVILRRMMVIQPRSARYCLRKARSPSSTTRARMVPHRSTVSHRKDMYPSRSNWLNLTTTSIFRQRKGSHRSSARSITGTRQSRNSSWQLDVMSIFSGSMVSHRSTWQHKKGMRPSRNSWLKLAVTLIFIITMGPRLQTSFSHFTQ